MNVKQFQEGVQLMNNSGFKLTELETALIENSLTIVQSDNKFQDIFFFGRIDTVGADRYYLAFGYSKDILKDLKFFYSINSFEWFMLPDVKPKLLTVARKTKTHLRGDPAFIEEVIMNPTFIPDDDEVFVSCPPAVKKIKEEDRLACIVQFLMSESALVPRSVLYRQVNCCVTYNPFFRGLTNIDASQLKNFQLFRAPVNNYNYNLIKREDYNYQTDFFDTIDDLVPAHSYSININDRDVCLVRSLKWPGMILYHKLNTMFQGFFYFGNGRENLDLLFMQN